MRKLSFFVVLALLILLLPTFAQAQTAIPANAPFQLLSDHDGADNTTSYRCFLGAQLTQTIARATVAANSNVVVCQYAAQPPGTYVVHVEAVNQFAAGRATATAVTGTGPTPPGNLRIITVTVTVTGP